MAPSPRESGERVGVRGRFTILLSPENSEERLLLTRKPLYARLPTSPRRRGEVMFLRG
jgi:hypothetical protein